MNNGSRRALSGSIHKIREFELEQVCLVEEFDILQIVGEGWFGKILLVEHRGSDTEIVLKALPKPYVSIRDFYREFHYSLHLSAHRNIVTTFDVAFETAGFYVFCQEYAPLGDLTSNMFDTGIGEIHTKRVAKQLAAALEHLHQRELVHRDVKLDNVLVFKSDFSRIKLCDFGETRKVHSPVKRRNEWLPYSPPEVLKLAMDTTYKALISHDIWQFGIVIFICLTGCLPWQKAATDDPRYTSYFNWYNSANPLKRQPKLWKMVSSKAQKMFKKFIEPREDRRVTNFQEVSRFLDDRWLAKGYTDRVAGGDIDELCPSMYSFHSDPNEKDILLKHFKDNGIETTIDRHAKKQRIKEWIQNSVIEEVNEEEETSTEHSVYEDSDAELEDHSRGHPLDESHRVTLRYDTEKHINPRTGEVIDGQKKTPTNVHPLSYDVQDLEPVATSNVVRRYGIKEDGTSIGSTKDSAYGSIESKTNNRQTESGKKYASKAKNATSLDSSNHSPSRSLSSVSLKQNRSPLLTHHAQRIKKSEEVYSEELRNIQGGSSSSTLHSMGNSSRSNSLRVHNSSVDIQNNTGNSTRSNSLRVQNGSMDLQTNLPPKLSPRLRRPSPAVTPTKSNDPSNFSQDERKKSREDIVATPKVSTKSKDDLKYISMKDTAYDSVKIDSTTNENSNIPHDNQVPESPYTSMMNIVQAQIKISPHGNEINKNVVNVSLTPIQNKNQRHSMLT